MCIKGARVIIRDLKTEPSLLVLVFILFAVVVGFQYKGGSEALMLLIAAVVTMYSGKVKQTKEGQEQFERRIKRIQTQTYGWLVIAVAVSNLNSPFNQYSAYGIAIVAIIVFIHRVANAEADLSSREPHEITSERRPTIGESYGHTAHCRMTEESNRALYAQGASALPLHYGISRPLTDCDCTCHVTQSYRLPQS